MIEVNRNIAIVVVAYNRPAALQRILHSIAKAEYSGYSDIPLIISIDKSNEAEVSALAKEFAWKFGTKEVIEHPVNLGLKNHVISCGDLTEKYDNVIVLEDDVYVSPFFYDYAMQALGFYKGRSEIGGISLYGLDYNDHAMMPFLPVCDGFDNYFMQIPASLGQLWTLDQWRDFKRFYSSKDASLVPSDPIPDKVIAWGESSWKKYYYKYLAVSGKYFVYPRYSLTTNFGDAGTHFTMETERFQVNLLMGKRKFSFCHLHQSKAIYDAWHEIEGEVLKYYNSDFSQYDLECDVFGEKPLGKVKKKYLISVKSCSRPIAVFSYSMFPPELCLCLGIKGSDLKWGLTSDFSEAFDMQQKLKHPTYSKLNRYILRARIYGEAEANMQRTMTYRIGNIFTYPLRAMLKALGREK